MQSLKISALFFIMICSFLYDPMYGAEKTSKLLDNKPFYKVSPLSLDAVEQEAKRSQGIEDFMIHFPWAQEGFNLLRSQEVPIESFYQTLDRFLVVDLLDSQNKVIGQEGLAYRDVMHEVIQELFDAMKEPFINTLLDALGSYQDELYFNWAILDYVYHHENQNYDKIFHYVLKYKDTYLKDEVDEWFDELLNNSIMYKTIDFKTLYKFLFLLDVSIHKQIINSYDGQELTFLDYAIMDNNVECVKFLLQNGAQISQKDGFTNVLHIAVLHGYQEIVDQLLLSNPKIVNTLDAKQRTPLYCAVFTSNLDFKAQKIQRQIIEKLLFFGAQINITSYYGYTPLHLAAGHGYYDIAHTLLKNGANPNISADDNGIETPLLTTIQSDTISIDMIELLLDFGAKLDNRVDHQGLSVLGYAINYPQVVKLLLQSGADVNLADIDEDGLIKMPLLHKAVLNENMSVIRILLDYRADINALGGITGGTALHEAVQLCNKKIVALLLQDDVDKNILDDQGITPYQVAKFQLDDFNKDLDKAAKIKFSYEVISQLQHKIKDMLAIIALLS